ncbi:MAG: hypothetical protein QGM50_05075 [Anaerolineae bacterium]|nr:hypothetical protein [Anaerolineae bacterium]MDK1118148.1 hypothetical protein [Anaerolineae bacterium]
MGEWSFNPLVAIGIVLAIMFFGYFFGLFEGRGQGYKKRIKEEKDDASLLPNLGEISSSSSQTPSDEIPVLNLSKDTSGMLRMKMDGKETNTLALDADQRKRLIEILTHMRPWLEGPSASTPPAQPQAATPSKPLPSPNTTPQQVSRPTTSNGDEPGPGPKSIVSQIDVELQSQIAGTPLADRSIRLQESLEGGVIVWVGVNKYENIEHVPDEDIKAAFKAAVAEWEKKYTPGL